MATLDPATQLTTIQAAEFFTALRAALQTVSASMVANNYEIDGKVELEVEGVPVVAILTAGSTDLDVEVGQDVNGNPFYSWHAPVGWVS